MKRLTFNRRGVWAIYKFEMARFRRTLLQSVVTPVITTSLYFVVFGSAIGSRISHVNGVPYGAFIVPGLMMLSLFTESISNASFGIYFPKFTGTIYELLSAPVSALEIVLGYVGAAATKSIILGLIILITASMFVPIQILHPAWMIAFLLLTGQLQPVRVHRWRLGEWFRATAIHSDVGGNAADISRRGVLFDHRAAGGVAHGHAVQSCGLSDQRLPLELLWNFGRQRRDQSGDDAGLFRALPGAGDMDLQDRISAEKLKAASRPGPCARCWWPW